MTQSSDITLSNGTAAKAKHTWKLNSEQREFVIECLACGMTDQQVADWLRDRFGVRISRQAICRFRKTRANARRIALRRAEVFDQLESSKLPFVKKYQRVAHYSMFAASYINKGNYQMAARNLRAIALEMGHIGPKREDPSANLTIAELAQRVQETLDRLGIE